MITNFNEYYSQSIQDYDMEYQTPVIPMPQISSAPYENRPYSYDMANSMPSYEPVTFNSGNLPESITNPIYTPSFLTSQIGKVLKVESLIGDKVVEREGRLVAVGASYILLRSLKPGSKLMCDIDSIKFVTIVDDEEFEINAGTKAEAEIYVESE